MYSKRLYWPEPLGQASVVQTLPEASIAIPTSPVAAAARYPVAGEMAEPELDRWLMEPSVFAVQMVLLPSTARPLTGAGVV
jgi:hypothetical protein